MKVYLWKWGFRFWIRGITIGILGPLDKPLFSERNGYRLPIAKLGKWRLFFDNPQSAKEAAICASNHPS
jgi:hypothetical protein